MTSTEAVKAAHAAHVPHVDSTGGDYEGYCDDPELCPLMEPFAVALDAFRKSAIDTIAESVIVRHVCLPGTPVVQGCCQTTWGCGICQGEYQGADKPDGRGVYAHKDWCPRK